MLIDAHNHPNWWGHDGQKILANMDEQGIDKMWLLTWECRAVDSSPRLNDHMPVTGEIISLSDVLSVAREAPDRFVLGYAPDPKRPDAIDRLKAAVEIHGIRIAGELKVRQLADDPDAIGFYRTCGEAGLPVTIHLEYPIERNDPAAWTTMWYGGSIDSLERAIIACPDTVFIGHAKGFWAHISGDDLADKVPSPKGPVLPGGRVPEMLSRYPNLYADLSGNGVPTLERDLVFSRQFLIDHQDKLLFARDQFHTRLMDLLMSLDLPKPAFDKLTHGNALKLLGDQ